MNKVDKHNYCSIPFGSAFIHPTGKITPCCILMPHEWNSDLNKGDTLEEAFHNKEFEDFRDVWRSGYVHPQCQKKCFDAANNTAHRTMKSEKIDKVLKGDTKNPKKLIIDIGFGNICNLTCSMCDEVSSHSWAKLKNKKEKIWSFDKETLIQTAESLKDAVEISIKGGEPFNIPHLNVFLDRLTEINPTVTVDILSNGSEISDRDIETLKRVKNLHMSFSIEAMGDMYRYIRGGKYDFDNLFNNIRRLKDAGIYLEDICFASIIMFYNHRQWDTDFIAMTEKFKKELDINIEIVTQICTFPGNQSIFLLKEDLRKDLINRIDAAVDSKRINLRDWKGIKKLLSHDRKVYEGGEPVTREMVYNWIKYMNLIRQMDFEKIVPDIMDDIKDSIN